MARNNNGFADALKDINTLLKVDEDVSMDVLEDAADYFAKKLKPRIPVYKKNNKNMRDALKVVVKDDKVSVEFEDWAYYWYMVDKGHRKRGGKGKVKGQHFVQNTWDADGDKVSDIMADKILKKMGG